MTLRDRASAALRAWREHVSVPATDNADEVVEPDDDDVIERFNVLYYSSADTTWRNTRWLGAEVQKCPTDLWIYQELIHDARPDVIVETGTLYGGSACFLASICDAVGHGEVVTIDVTEHPDRPQHQRIRYLTGSSVDMEMVERVRALVGNGRAMVVLDSDHTKPHVLAEMNAYGPMVAAGCYMVVEDTNINGHPVPADNEGFPWTEGPGPWEAVDEFLSRDATFEIDASMGKFLLTQNPRGFLRKR